MWAAPPANNTGPSGGAPPPTNQHILKVASGCWSSQSDLGWIANVSILPELANVIRHRALAKEKGWGRRIQKGDEEKGAISKRSGRGGLWHPQREEIKSQRNTRIWVIYRFFCQVAGQAANKYWVPTTCKGSTLWVPPWVHSLLEDRFKQTPWSLTLKASHSVVHTFSFGGREWMNDFINENKQHYL